MGEKDYFEISYKEPRQGVLDVVCIKVHHMGSKVFPPLPVGGGINS